MEFFAGGNCEAAGDAFAKKKKTPTRPDPLHAPRQSFTH